MSGRTRAVASRAPCVAAWLALLVGALAWSTPARAAARSFTARVDRTQVPVDDSFIYEATLVLEDGRAEGYTAPEFDGFRVLGHQPSQSTQIQMGGGASFMQVVYSWRYELAPLKKGAYTIGPARVRVQGRELRTNPITITVGEAVARAATPPAGRQSPFPEPLFPPSTRAPRPDAQGENFVRATPTKTTAFVGEQVTVDWGLFLVERQDKYQPLSEPRTDGFWSEDLPVAGNQRGLSLSPQTVDGRTFLVAPLMRKALFPLRPGKLTITPLEAEISQVDFFGSTVRTERLKANTVTLDVLPLPTAGQPRNFDPTSVGRFTIAAKVDRDRVAVGEAVTLAVSVTGTGNVRQLAVPRPAAPDGWKMYEPKVSVNVTPGDPITGSKTVEYLMLPERPGVTTIAALELPFFDPAEKRYVVERTEALRVEAVGEAGAVGSGVASSAAASGGAATGKNGPFENVLPTELRPIRAKGALRRDLGTTLYRSRFFLFVVAFPPLAFGLTVLVSNVRERLTRETERGRQRKTRRLLRKRLVIAERHLAAGEASAFYIEIDRVLRELLTGKLRTNVTGLPRDELRARLAASGFAPELVERVIGELEACDQARFAPGSVGSEAMAATLERAGELMLVVEKAKIRSAEAA